MSGQLKEVRERIRSVISTQQITKAMKMVSAAKLRKAQQAIVQMRPYADKLAAMLRNLMASMEGDTDMVFNRVSHHEKPLLVVITSNRGLCGAYNANIIKTAVAYIHDHYQKQRQAGQLSILCIGKKGNEFFRKHYKDCNIISDFVHHGEKLVPEEVTALAIHLRQGFIKGDFDSIDIAFGRFRNAAMQYPEILNYLPVPKDTSKSKKKRTDYLFEPDKQQLLDTLVPAILEIQIQRALFDNQASEQGARMTAMDKATENAEELLKELRINYNKARQAAITTEISEIVGGAAALGG